MIFKPYILSGICVCGHRWDQHHLHLIVNTKVLDFIKKNYPSHPPYVPGGCEFYGFNENEGMMPHDEEGWAVHCRSYLDTHDNEKNDVLAEACCKARSEKVPK